MKIFEDQEQQNLVSFKGRGQPGEVLEKGILTNKSPKKIEFIWVVDSCYRIWVAEPRYSFKIKGKKSKLLKVEFSVVNLDWFLHKLVEWHDYFEGCEDMRHWTQEGPTEETLGILKRPTIFLQVREGPFENFSRSWGVPAEPLVLTHSEGGGYGCCVTHTYQDALGWLWSNSSHDGIYRIPGLDHEA